MNNKKIIGATLIAVIFIVFLIVGYTIQKSKKNMDYNDISVYKGSNFTENKSEASYNTVDESGGGVKKVINAQIYGEVKKPGVYTLENGKMVKDLIDKAGGFTENADCFSINGAKKISDGDDIEVKSKTQNTTQGAAAIGGTNVNADGTNTNTGNDKLDINRATEDDIINKKIPGIGKGIAEKIIKFRQSNGGRINSEKDMETAIGPNRGKKIMDYIEIN
ncbi:SLBB domain-containing protein [Clostridium akagii]|uniref:SLBB domain-containing protein n=1 Tax=Clostridium akagii TaxID=91623 RepID=UPI00047BC22B|nr:SLBB domain-containing protein [Clostridium akagii]